MKKLLTLLLTFAIIMTLFGCGAESQNTSEAPEMSAQTENEPVNSSEEFNLDGLSPLEISQVVYQMLNLSASATDIVGRDICIAWQTAIMNEDNIVNKGASYLCENLNMNEDALRAGLANVTFSKTGGDWNSITDAQWEELKQNDSLFAEAQEEGNLLGCCISVVWSGYLELDFFNTMDKTMSEIKEGIRKLKEIDPENENIEPLKGYYSAIHSYLEWCKAPDGSYNEAKELLNSYEDSYRSYRDDLEFDLGE